MGAGCGRGCDGVVGNCGKAATARVDAAKAEILEKLGTNSTALVDGYQCRAPLTSGGADKVITADMVGQVIKGRAAHRRFYIRERDNG